MSRKKYFSKKGFTLIELLIVITIISILAGIILVSTSIARNKARMTATKQVMASVKNGIASCCYNADAATLVVGGANPADNTDMCSSGTSGAYFPTLAQVGSDATIVDYTVINDCNSDTPTIMATITSGLCDGTISVIGNGINGGTSPCL